MTFTATDWAALASGCAAVGTLALAGVTWRLANRTSDMAAASRRAVELQAQELGVIGEQARATEAQAELSARAMRASQQPWLVPAGVVPPGLRRFVSLDGMRTDVAIGHDAMCWEEASGGPIWVVVPVRNIGTGPAFIPVEQNSVMGQFSLYGSLATFGRPSLRVLARDDAAFLVFRALYGVERSFNWALQPDEAGLPGIVCVRYTGIDTATITQSRFVYTQFSAPELLDPTVTISEVRVGAAVGASSAELPGRGTR